MTGGFRELLRLGLSQSTGKWLILGSCVGILCGLVGFAFHVGVEFVAHLSLSGMAGWRTFQPVGAQSLHSDEGSHPFSPSALIGILALGGLVAGLIAHWISADAKGGGTGTAVRAFHQQQGRIPLRTSFAKFFASLATLGTGGSAGREGPISLIGAGFGSWLSDRLGLSARDRRILLTAGIAGGVAALFRAPLAGALYAAEVLYRDSELEAEVLIPGFIAAIIAFCTFGLLEGALISHDLTVGIGSSLFHTPAGLGFSVGRWTELGGYLVVVLVVAVVARVFITVEHRAAHRLTHIAAPIWLRPAIGAACAGAVALVATAISWLAGLRPEGDLSALGILGSGYGAIQQALHADVLTDQRWHLVALFSIIAFGKILATACTVGSGGSGGEFAPSIVIGGCLGAAVGFALRGLSIAPHPAACTIMGMAGFLAATHRTPIAALLMVSEITGNYLLLIPAMWVTALSFLLVGRVSIISGQVDGPLASPAHRGHFFNDLLTGIRVSDAMENAEASHTLKPGSRLAECRQILRDSHQTVFPVVDDEGKLVGEVTLDDLRAFLYDQDLDLVAVAQDVMAARAWSVTPKDSLALAMRRFNAANVDELPVVEPITNRFLGLLTRRQCIGYYNKTADQLRAQRRAEGYESEDGTVE